MVIIVWIHYLGRRQGLIKADRHIMRWTDIGRHKMDTDIDEHRKAALKATGPTDADLAKSRDHKQTGTAMQQR